MDTTGVTEGARGPKLSIKDDDVKDEDEFVESMTTDIVNDEEEAPDTE